MYMLLCMGIHIFGMLNTRWKITKAVKLKKKIVFGRGGGENNKNKQTHNINQNNGQH